MSRVAILTLPPTENYGGILQCFALKSYLESCECEVEIINLGKKNLNFFKSFVKTALKFIPFQNINNYKSDYKRELLLKPTLNFIFPNTSPKLTGDSELAKYFMENKFSHIIVGSDQVWRYKYGKEFFPNFFINFNIPCETKKIAFSASFGTSKWECDAVRDEVSGYLSNFDAISLREYDGVELCSKYFGINAPTHTCDPTLLNDTSLYLELCHNIPIDKKKLSTYVLDSRPSVNMLISDMANALNVNIGDIHQFGHRRSRKFRDDSLDEWLAVFRDSEFIITDSFHGMIFSIIFRKPFYVIVNNARGASRFESLLSLLGLTDRMIDPDTPVNIDELNSNLDYAKVIGSLDGFISLSKDFLQASLKTKS